MRFLSVKHVSGWGQEAATSDSDPSHSCWHKGSDSARCQCEPIITKVPFSVWEQRSCLPALESFPYPECRFTNATVTVAVGRGRFWTKTNGKLCVRVVLFALSRQAQCAPRDKRLGGVRQFVADWLATSRASSASELVGFVIRLDAQHRKARSRPQLLFNHDVRHRF